MDSSDFSSDCQDSRDRNTNSSQATRLDDNPPDPPPDPGANDRADPDSIVLGCPWEDPNLTPDNVEKFKGSAYSISYWTGVCGFWPCVILRAVWTDTFL